MANADVFLFTRKATFIGWLLNNQPRINTACDDDEHFDDFNDLYDEVSQIFGVNQTGV